MTRPIDDPYLQGVFDTLVALRQYVDNAFTGGELGPMPIATMITMVESIEKDMCEGVTAERLVRLTQDSPA